MSREASRTTRWLVSLLVLVFLLASSMTGRPAEALPAVGDSLFSLGVPPAGVCGSGFTATSGFTVAIVQGSKVGRPEPILLVTSCVVPGDGPSAPPALRLFFIDPAINSDGGPSVVATLDSIFTAGDTNKPTVAGWEALALRTDTGDLLACGRTSPTQTVLYKVDFSQFNSIPDGTATFLRAGPTDSSCNGIAWDAGDQAIFQASTGTNVFRIVNATGATTTIPSGCATGFGVFGLSVAGPSLFVGCTHIDIITFNPAPTRFMANAARRPGWRTGDAIVSSEFDDFLKSIGAVLAGGPTPPPFPSVIRQLNKATGADLGRTLSATSTIATFDLGGFACDAVSFASQYEDALWVKDAASNSLKALHVPAGTCSLSGTLPLLSSPGACPTIHPVTGATIDPSVYYDANGKPKDADGDGLLDCWEDGSLWPDGRPGISLTPNANGTSTRDIVLCVGTGATACADKNFKDVFVELDAMTGHVPDANQVASVVTAFANAPLLNPGPGSCASGSANCGIRLHIQVDEQNITHATNTAFPPCTPVAVPGDANFDDIKKARFGTATERNSGRTIAAKKLAFHYGLGVHNLTRDNPNTTSSPSGCAEVPGNDFIIATGSLGTATLTTGLGLHKNGGGTQEYWAGTLMHELGHNLGLRHGGFENVNCKPNYLSVMSYTRQFRTVVSDRPLDYSRQQLPTLIKGALNESQGILGSPPVTLEQTPGAPTARTVYGTGTGSTAKISAATGAINWNSPTNNTIDPSVNVDVNNIGNVSGCDGASDLGATLVGFDDWDNLVFAFQNTLDFGDGSHPSADEVQEMTDAQDTQLGNLVDADADDRPDKLACGLATCAIDIVPLVPNNIVLLFKKDGVPTAIIPVAVLSSTVFNATLLDPFSLKFAGTPVSQINGRPVCANLDVNRDGRKDLVCTFVVKGLSPGPQSAILEGVSPSGTTVPITIRAEGTMLVVDVPKDRD